MWVVGETYRIPVPGHGECDGVFLGRVPVADILVGDVVGVLFMGGYAHLIVRIGAIALADGGTRLVFDWNGYREGRPGGSLLADDITVPAGDSCREVWRPVGVTMLRKAE